MFNAKSTKDLEFLNWKQTTTDMEEEMSVGDALETCKSNYGIEYLK